jgi:hypothetical protein
VALGLPLQWEWNKYGFIDEKGETVIEPCFDGVGEFTTNGLARVEAEGKVGYLRLPPGYRPRAGGAGGILFD